MTGDIDDPAAALAAPLAVSIRLEAPGDEPGVRDVELAAFGGPEEAEIVDRIRAEAPAGWLSLVAADAAGDIVGHLLLSPCPVEDDAGAVRTTVLAIGPVAVRPSAQRRGVGAALMYAAMSLAMARGAPALVLLGHADYYPRFGFEPARPLGIEPEVATWPDEAWMALRLADWTPELRGVAHFPPAFGEAS